MPGAELLPLLVPPCSAGVKDFDDPTINRCIGHTFTGLPANIDSATLEIHLRAGNHPLSCNDPLTLQVDGGAFAWSRFIGTNLVCNAAPGLLNNPPIDWVIPADAVICLDLADLPNVSGASTNILPLMNATGRLDIHVQDDTDVDYALLKIVTCQACEGDANGDGTIDPLDAGYVLARLGCPVGTGDPGCDAADQNGDGAVDPLDVGFVLARFGSCL